MRFITRSKDGKVSFLDHPFQEIKENDYMYLNPWYPL